MKKSPLWKDFAHIDTWIFDLDNTLYPAKSNLFAKIDQKMGEFICNFLKVELPEAKAIQKKYFREHGTTLNGLMVNYGMDPADFLEYVHDIDVTDLATAPELSEALEKLEGRKIIFTNGSLYHATNVCTQLGITHHFEHIFDIVAAEFRPKPDINVYRELVRQQNIDPEKAVLFEDMAVNLVPAHEMGMTTVWIPNDAHWSGDDTNTGHVHYQTDNLTRWLRDLADDKIRSVA
ncbi:pyrimidine 5'-nucleotidase [Sneathiella sp.]|uniref:pyrimidine 5'-nucleotidase n=1 Tax=Sneathiella sp. TaxID=1964365 RepID=UPI003562EB37